MSELRQSAKAASEAELHKQFEMESLIYSQDQTYLKEIGKSKLKLEITDKFVIN